MQLETCTAVLAAFLLLQSNRRQSADFLDFELDFLNGLLLFHRQRHPAYFSHVATAAL
jgi:hypothetical protein